MTNTLNISSPFEIGSVALLILSYLNAQDLATCAQVCRQWHKFADSQELWKRICEKSRINACVLDTWKETYVSLLDIIQGEWCLVDLGTTVHYGVDASVYKDFFASFLQEKDQRQTIILKNWTTGAVVSSFTIPNSFNCNEGILRIDDCHIILAANDGNKNQLFAFDHSNPKNEIISYDMSEMNDPLFFSSGAVTFLCDGISPQKFKFQDIENLNSPFIEVDLPFAGSYNLFDKKNCLIYYFDPNCFVNIWDIEEKNIIKKVELAWFNSNVQIKFIEDHMLAYDTDINICFWDLNTLEESFAKFTCAPKTLHSKNTSEIVPDFKRHLIYFFNESGVFIFSDSGELMREVLFGDGFPIESKFFSVSNDKIFFLDESFAKNQMSVVAEFKLSNLNKGSKDESRG